MDSPFSRTTLGKKSDTPEWAKFFGKVIIYVPVVWIILEFWVDAFLWIFR